MSLQLSNNKLEDNLLDVDITDNKSSTDMDITDEESYDGEEGCDGGDEGCSGGDEGCDGGDEGDEGCSGGEGCGIEDKKQRRSDILDTITENNKVIFIKNNNLKNVIIKKDIPNKEDCNYNNDGGIIDYLVDILSNVIDIINYKKIIHYGKYALNYIMMMILYIYNMFMNNNTNKINLKRVNCKNNFGNSKNNFVNSNKKKIFIKNKNKSNCDKCSKILNSYLDTEKKIFLLKN